MKNILVTNFNDESENVLIFADKLTSDNIKTVLTKTKTHFDEIYEISPDDRQYYSFDPLYLSEENENQVLNDFIN